MKRTTRSQQSKRRKQSNPNDKRRVIMDQVFEAAVRSKIAKLEKQLAECKKERNDLYKMGLTQSKTINRLEDLLFKVGADKTGEK